MEKKIPNTEEECIKLLKDVKNKGGKLSFNSLYKHLVNRNSILKNDLGLNTNPPPSLMKKITETLKIESDEDWQRIKEKYDL